ncbi:Na/Pi symporter [Chryseolinea sp. H1M3-3]|uniref:Na/Pi cotransporter family protein n=1 Tax=Chryseolinea sp. H1M3-3 TaxID=3034144 RepID=UPI0023EB1C47|nr:Na/Pi symporter [Chryseolinea sp. H1M3-3]
MDTWKFIAGLGLFLYGMTVMERVLKNLSGRSFKLFLRKYTQSLPKAIVGGALITGLVQSSSVVSLLVLAFVEAGTITFRNALGVILGSNVGTTLTSWIVATIGFKLDIESYSLPIVGISAIAMFFSSDQKSIYNIFRLCFSFGILFLGLAFMKGSAESFVSDIDLMTYSRYGTWIFVLIGFAVTVLIQASSATVAITLTALYTGAINFPMAAAVVIGSELGTTIKVVMAGLGGTADKKRVAWGNFTFNFVTCVVVFVFLPWLITFIRDVVNIKDPLIGLVFLQTTMNLLSILLFVPFINVFANWLSRRFADTAEDKASFIGANLPVVPELAVDAMLHEGNNLLKKTLEFLERLLQLNDRNAERRFLGGLSKPSDTVNTIYSKLKQTEGSILEYYTRLQTSELNKEQYNQLNQYITTTRYCIRAAKAMKDIHHNLKDFQATANDTLHMQYQDLQKDWMEFDSMFQSLMRMEDSKRLFEELTLLMRRAFHNHQRSSGEILEALHKKALHELEVSTLMNVHHEVLSVKKSLLRALAHLRLNPAQSDEFEFLPES